MKFWKKLFPNHRPAHPYCSALIAAAGSSRRMEGENKLLLPLGGKPVIVHTLEAMDASPSIREIILAVREEDLLRFAELCKTYEIKKPVKVIVGGKTRTESVLRAAAEANENADLLAVQDGARPFVTPELIERVIEAARVNFAAAPAIPVKDTIKVAENGVVRETPDRSTLYAVQTPQVFDAQLLRAALQSAVDADAELTDDCSAVERMGKEIYLTEGSEENIKLTTPMDLFFARAILERREVQGSL
ncbi:MAG: 2-C-methyl-D-erythritol 4-phosphate cytidylyltransferase [Ruminococcaceae bacterium]|jgi:2-C-methyl-D-erythritol 4-phosphate cytidylyltransferase|nr:2-C-methyl-D-erythritol 4-phosphate cytidylyltransferase [Oscillospiraceae bacterium]